MASGRLRPQKGFQPFDILSCWASWIKSRVFLITSGDEFLWFRRFLYGSFPSRLLRHHLLFTLYHYLLSEVVTFHQYYCAQIIYSCPISFQSCLIHNETFEGRGTSAPVQQQVPRLDFFVLRSPFAYFIIRLYLQIQVTNTIVLGKTYNSSDILYSAALRDVRGKFSFWEKRLDRQNFSY